METTLACVTHKELMKMLEREIERRLVTEVKHRGGICLKQNGLVGIPDRLVLLQHGRMAFVELKAPGKKPREIQEFRMKQLQELGFRCYVIDNAQTVGGILDEIQSA